MIPAISNCKWVLVELMSFMDHLQRIMPLIQKRVWECYSLMRGGTILFGSCGLYIGTSEQVLVVLCSARFVLDLDMRI